MKLKKSITVILMLSMIVSGCSEATSKEIPADETYVSNVSAPVNDSTEKESKPDNQENNIEKNEDVTIETELVIAGVGIRDFAINYYVNMFNQSQNDYQLSVVDYLQDGIDYDQALQKLHTEIIAGNGPDILFMDGLEASVYGKKELIIDLYPLLQSDDKVREEDIVILKSLMIQDKMYMIAPEFCIDTLTTVHPDYIDKDGWTLDEYLNAEANLDSWQDMIYYMTPSYYLETFAGLYATSAVDIENVSCDFNNTTFTKLLEGVKMVSVKEDTSGPAKNAMAEGQLMCCAEWIDSVDDLAFSRFLSGNMKRNVIGFPTPDGSSGSMVKLIDSMAITSNSKNIDACWEFIKYVLTNAPVEDPFFRLSTYEPSLRRSFEIKKEENRYDLQQEDYELIRKLAADCVNVSAYHKSIMTIILEEAEPMLAEEITASEAAQRIQDRVSLLVMEKYG